LKTILLFCIVLTGVFSEARVLSLSEEKFASYFSVESGVSTLGSTPFDQNLSDVDSFSETYKTSLGGEFGFVYSSPYIAWRFSFGIIKPSKLKEVQGLAGSSVQYLVDSDITAVAPKLGIEIHLNRKPNYRFYLFGFYGSSNLTVANVYTQTVSPNVDHTVDLKSSATETGGGFGFETSFVDTTSFIIELGYRSLMFKELAFSKDVVTFQGAKTAGELLKNLDGENKSLNFSGYILSVGFRFWL
jgi:hypothetical protein